MNQILKFKFVLLLIFVFHLFSCSSGKSANKTDGNSFDFSNPTVGVIQEDSFYVRLYEDGKYPYYMSKKGDFSNKCSIASGAASQILDCILDVNELDLYFNGAKFQYNVPSAMCNYVSFTPYWYYNYEFGNGPANIVINETKDDKGNILSADCTFDGAAGCNGSSAIYDASKDVLSCAYDNSSNDGPNCCIGDYVKTIRVTQASGGTPVDSVTKGNWGGSVKNCIGGAARTNWSAFTKSGYPVEYISYTQGAGLNTTYEITAPIISTHSAMNIPIANYYTPARHTHSGTVSASTSTLPYIVDPIDDRTGNLLVAGNPYYLWTCYDRNYEIVHQIRVAIREWNTYQEFVKFGTTGGASGDPDVVGAEGTNCGSSISNYSCNDFIDMDDRGQVNPSATTKKFMYPRDSY
jgi:hypothetical protein